MLLMFLLCLIHHKVANVNVAKSYFLRGFMVFQLKHCKIAVLETIFLFLFCPKNSFLYWLYFIFITYKKCLI